MCRDTHARDARRLLAACILEGNLHAERSLCYVLLRNIPSRSGKQRRSEWGRTFSSPDGDERNSSVAWIPVVGLPASTWSMHAA